MTTHSISSGVNKQVLDETLDIIFICARLLYIHLFASRNERGVIKAAISAQRSPKAERHNKLPSVLFVLFFYIVIREKYVLPFPRGFPGTVSQCERAPWGCLGQFSFNKVFFVLFCSGFFVSIVTTLLCCFADFPAVLLPCLESNAGNL